MGYVLKGFCSEKVEARRRGTREVGEQEEGRVREGEKGKLSAWTPIG